MTEKTMYVRIDEYENRVGVLHCDKPAHPGYGFVQLGAAGPWAYVQLDSLTPITGEEFHACLGGSPAPRRASKVYEQ